jgi:hypothetical protein
MVNPLQPQLPTNLPPEEREKLTGMAKKLACLKPAKKGEVRNPNGIGSGYRWAEIDNLLLSASRIDLKVKTMKDGKPAHLSIKLDVGSKRTFRHVISIRQIQMAIAGDITAIKDLRDRDMGKAVQFTQSEVTLNQPPTITLLNESAIAEVQRLING